MMCLLGAGFRISSVNLLSPASLHEQPVSTLGHRGISLSRSGFGRLHRSCILLRMLRFVCTEEPSAFLLRPQHSPRLSPSEPLHSGLDSNKHCLVT